MAEIITGIRMQPAFPSEDLSDDNASMLELLLANETLVEKTHHEVEKLSWMYKVGHAVVVAGTSRVYEKGYHRAINTGVSMFETMSAIVAGDVPTIILGFAVNGVASDIIHAKNDAQLIDYALEAVNKFRVDLPRATDVVLEASKRQHYGLQHYALLGAAFERQFAIDATENSHSYSD